MVYTDIKKKENSRGNMCYCDYSVNIFEYYKLFDFIWREC